MDRFLIHNARIITRHGEFNGYMAVTPPYIDAVGAGEPTEEMMAQYANSIDAEGKYLLAGAIDDQVHFREPGLTHKADIHSESRAAAAGGVTSFMDMPNTKPPTLSMEEIERKHTIASAESLVNYSFFIGASRDNIDELRRTDFRRVPGIKLFLGSSTGNMLVDDEEVLDAIFSLGKLVAIHSEDDSIIRHNMKVMEQRSAGQDIDVKYHPIIRSRKACYESTRKAVERARRFDTRLHVLHVSTEDELEFFAPGRPADKKVTAEVCVHHLWFTDADYSRLGNSIKWNPAIKTPFDRQALRQAIAEGRIDAVATDHAPHILSEKSGDVRKAASGAPIVQFTMPMMLDMCAAGCFPLTTVTDMMSSRPAELYGIEKRGELKPGYYADFVLAERVEPYEVRKEDVLSKCGWSPLESSRLQHRIAATYVNGRMVYDGKSIIETSAAMPLRYRPQ